MNYAFAKLVLQVLRGCNFWKEHSGKDLQFVILYILHNQLAQILGVKVA